jgi:hypothetical protein
MTPQLLRVRVVVGQDDGQPYVLSALEGDSRFDRPAERFLTCDRIIADQIVTVPLARGAAANGGE